MKINNIFSNGLLLVMALLTVSAFTACNDEPDKYEVSGGSPVVRYVRTPFLSQKDSLITEASTGMTICLVGENLRSVTEMYFNDKKAILNSSYITDNTLIVDIPKSIPDVVTDKIYMINSKKDTTTYDFHISVPAPTLTEMSCEYAPAGSNVSITGNYFVDDPNTPLVVELPDGQKVTEFSNISQTSISFVMPECKTEGPLKVTTIYGTTTSKFHYLDSRGMLFDFDGATGLGNHGWHDRPITTDNNAISGNYVQLGNGTAVMSADGGWDDSQFSFEYWPGSWDTPVQFTGDGKKLTDLVDFSDYENKAVKFELCIPSSNPWSAGAMQVIFAGLDKVSYGNADVSNGLAGPNNAYINNDAVPRALYRPWTSTGSYDTADKWVTVTLPIKSQFIYTVNGGTSTGTLSANDFTSLVIFVTGGGINGTECYPIFKIDNIRVVPN